MSKKCNRCGATVADNVNFCMNCGGSAFTANTETVNAGGYANATNPVNDGQTVLLSDLPGYGQPQQTYSKTAYTAANQYAGQTAYQANTYQTQSGQASYQPIPPVQQETPKKKKTWIVWLIIGIVLFVMAGIGLIAEKYFQSQGYGDGDDSNKDSLVETTDKFDDGEPTASSDSDYATSTPTLEPTEEPTPTPSPTPEKIAYTKGTFDGKTYVNEWANIKFELPSGFSAVDESAYSALNTYNTDCGAYYMADDMTTQFIVCFDKTASILASSYDEKKYLTASTAGLANSFKNNGLTYEFSDYSTTTIAGETYTMVRCTYGSGSLKAFYSLYVRKIDNYFAFISVISYETAVADNLVNSITTADEFSI